MLDHQRADLHVHTTASDGTLTPEEAVHEAARAGLYAIGIADHDSVDGIDRALAVAEDAGVVVVPGIEINTDVEKDELHILGYFVDHHSPVFREHVGKLKACRFDRGKAIVEKLNAVGVNISFQRVKEIADDASIGRPHVARAIVEAGYTGSINGAFGKYLIRGMPGYVERYKLTPVEAVKIVLEAGGVPVLAHPGHGKMAEPMLPELIEAGLRGLEAYHTDHDPKARKRFARMAECLGLIATGGSDSHGPGMVKDIRIGHATVGATAVVRLREASEEIRSSGLAASEQACSEQDRV